MNPTKINLIGGTAYSSTGGIQAVNRLLVRELSSAGLLRRAYFLWDSPSTARADAREYAERDLVRFYSLDHRRFTKDVFREAIRGRRDLWLCTHVNYALFTLLAAGGRSRRAAVMLHAAELDED